MSSASSTSILTVFTQALAPAGETSRTLLPGGNTVFRTNFSFAPTSLAYADERNLLAMRFSSRTALVPIGSISWACSTPCAISSALIFVGLL